MTGRYVSFLLGTGHYCVAVEEVLQIVRTEGILKVPTAPSFVTGVINLRGDVVPVVSLRRRLGISRAPEPSGHTESRARIIVVSVGGRSCGLAVDDVTEIVELEESAQEEETALPSAPERFVRDATHRDGSVFFILDTQRVASAGRDRSVASPI
ncbi:MAG TPA: chemotaxis protein CheW [Spirochaetia bacterium]|nr:chemotaxis protein CheW [Spirochaetia bacterium]